MKRWLPILWSTMACALTLLSVSEALADEPEPVHRYQDQTNPPSGTRTTLLLTGTAITAGFYAPVLGASYLWDQHPGATQMRIPIAGPWMAFGKTKLCNARPDLVTCNNFLVVTGAILLVLDGIGQAGGVALILESLFLPAAPSRAVRGTDETAYSAPRLETPYVEPPRGLLTMRKKNFSITPVPTVGGNSDIGLSMVGTF